MPLLGLVLGALPAAGVAAASGGVAIGMRCEASGGRLLVEPGGADRLPIVGPRVERPYSVCKAPGDCRTIVVYRFDVMCGHSRVPWTEVAAAMIAVRGGHVWNRGGRLNAKLLPMAALAVARACSQALVEATRASAGSGSFVDPICADVWLGRRGEPAAVDLPQGFAPVGEIGARFVPLVRSLPVTPSPPPAAAVTAAISPSTHPPSRPAAPGPVSPQQAGPPFAPPQFDPLPAPSPAPAPEPPQAALPAPPQVQPLAPAPPPAMNAPSPEASRPEIVLPTPLRILPPPASSAWVTLVEIEKATEQNHSIAAMILAVVLLSSLLSGAGWVVVQRWNRIDVPVAAIGRYEVVVRPETVTLAKPEAVMCGELCRTAQGLLEQIAASVETLRGVAPLRRVLVRETRNLEQFLASVVAAAPAEPSEWRRMRGRLQRLVSELMRLRDIVEAAGRSLAQSGPDRDLPRDRAEAFEVLGANPAVDTKIVKKLVDALRANWHPDLAVDDDDRRLREERIKAINAAWDLIYQRGDGGAQPEPAGMSGQHTAGEQRA